MIILTKSKSQGKDSVKRDEAKIDSAAFHLEYILATYGKKKKSSKTWLQEYKSYGEIVR